MKTTQLKQLLPNLKTELGEYQNQNVIWLHVDMGHNLKYLLLDKTKLILDFVSNRYCVPDTVKNRNLFGIEHNTQNNLAKSKICLANWAELRRYQHLLVLKGLSPNTQKTYTTEFCQLLQILGDYPVQDLSGDRIKSYILYCHQVLLLSENQIHSRINALKFYFEKVLHQEKLFFDIPRPKKPLLLPKSLSAEEVKKIIAHTENLKHRLVIKFVYGMGLRVSEIVNLRLEDIDSDRMVVLIHRGKGKKDRYVNLPRSILEELRLYYKQYHPQFYLFEGQDKNAYSVRSVQSIFKIAMKKAGIIKRVGIHALRHSYATHLLEAGTDISLIQKLLGHNNINTTLIYTQVSNKTIANVKSPLDNI